MGYIHPGSPRRSQTQTRAWRFEEHDGGCRIVFRYNFACQPKRLAPVLERVGSMYLGRDIRRRVEAFAAALNSGLRADPAEVAALE